MRRILLVDDNQEELDLFQRLLTREGQWQVEAVDNAAAALEKMRLTSFDVVVSDFLMPKMNGEQFLTRVMHEHAQTVRILLSGYFDWKTTPRVMKAAHQYLGKPCDPARLEETLSRALLLRDLIANHKLQGLVTQMKSLPSMPELCRELVHELSKPTPSTERVGEVIAKDLGMSAKLLQVVNSAFFGLAQRIADPREAVLYLGLQTIEALVLSLQIMASFKKVKAAEFTADRLWEHGWQTGLMARRLCQQAGLGRVAADEAFTAGLLHDVGKLMLATELPEQLQAVLKQQRETKSSYLQAERAVLGCTHAEVGAYLLGLWGLPPGLVEAVAFHHRLEGHPLRGFHAGIAVHVASAWEHERTPSGRCTSSSLLDREALTRLGLADRLPQWREAMSAMPSAEGECAAA